MPFYCMLFYCTFLCVLFMCAFMCAFMYDFLLFFSTKNTNFSHNIAYHYVPYISLKTICSCNQCSLSLRQCGEKFILVQRKINHRVRQDLINAKLYKLINLTQKYTTIQNNTRQNKHENIHIQQISTISFFKDSKQPWPKLQALDQTLY